MADHARAAIHGEAVDEPATEYALQRELRAAWAYLERRGKRPQSAADAVAGLSEYLAHQDAKFSEIGNIARTCPGFGLLYRRVRMRCGCGNGYLVVRKRWGHNYRFAGCSTYTASGCKFTIGSRDYTRIKSAVVLAIVRGETPEHDFFMLETVTQRVKNTRTRPPVTPKLSRSGPTPSQNSRNAVLRAR